MEPTSGKSSGSGEYDARYYRATYGTKGPRRLDMHWWAIRWYAGMARWSLRRVGGRRLLEIGCGQGFTLARLEDRYETWGIDISPFAIGEAREAAPRSRCSVADMERELPHGVMAGGFDLVMAKYVFEHLRAPGAAIARVAALLRPGGMLFFSVPYTGSLGARLKGPAWFASVASDPTHCSLLPREEWLRLTARAGLVLEHESADGWWDVPYLRAVPAWLQLPIFIAPTALACLSGRPLLPARWGENLLVFARKPG